MAAKPTKTCKTCCKELPLERFEEIRTNVYRNVCKICKTWGRAVKYSATPEAYLAVTLGNLRSLRRKQGVEFLLTEGELFEIWDEQSGRCALSGVLLTYHQAGHYGGGKPGDFNASIDRINPKAPYVKTNVQLVAWRINSMKNDMSEEMFFWWVRNLYKNHTEKIEGPSD